MRLGSRVFALGAPLFDWLDELWLSSNISGKKERNLSVSEEYYIL